MLFVVGDFGVVVGDLLVFVPFEWAVFVRSFLVVGVSLVVRAFLVVWDVFGVLLVRSFVVAAVEEGSVVLFVVGAFGVVVGDLLVFVPFEWAVFVRSFLVVGVSLVVLAFLVVWDVFRVLLVRSFVLAAVEEDSVVLFVDGAFAVVLGNFLVFVPFEWPLFVRTFLVVGVSLVVRAFLVVWDVLGVLLVRSFVVAAVEEGSVVLFVVGAFEVVVGDLLVFVPFEWPLFVRTFLAVGISLLVRVFIVVWNVLGVLLVRSFVVAAVEEGSVVLFIVGDFAVVVGDLLVFVPFEWPVFVRSFLVVGVSLVVRAFLVVWDVLGVLLVRSFVVAAVEEGSVVLFVVGAFEVVVGDLLVFVPFEWPLFVRTFLAVGISLLVRVFIVVWNVLGVLLVRSFVVAAVEEGSVVLFVVGDFAVVVGDLLVFVPFEWPVFVRSFLVVGVSLVVRAFLVVWDVFGVLLVRSFVVAAVEEGSVVLFVVGAFEVVVGDLLVFVPFEWPLFVRTFLAVGISLLVRVFIVVWNVLGVLLVRSFVVAAVEEGSVVLFVVGAFAVVVGDFLVFVPFEWPLFVRTFLVVGVSLVVRAFLVVWDVLGVLLVRSFVVAAVEEGSVVLFVVCAFAGVVGDFLVFVPFEWPLFVRTFLVVGVFLVVRAFLVVWDVLGVLLVRSFVVAAVEEGSVVALFGNRLTFCGKL